MEQLYAIMHQKEFKEDDFFWTALSPKPEGYKEFTFIVSDNQYDHVYDRVNPKGLRTTHFKENAPILFAHDNNKVLGQASRIGYNKDNTKVAATIWFDEPDPEAKALMEKVERNIIKSISMGFMGLEDKVIVNKKGGLDIDEWEILELSVGFGLGMNPRALRHKSLPFSNDSYLEKALQTKDGEVLKILSRFRHNTYLAESEVAKRNKNSCIPHCSDYLPMHGSITNKETDEIKLAIMKFYSKEDKLDFDNYSKFFATRDLDNLNNVKGYRGLHHDIDKDGNILLEKSQVIKSMLFYLTNLSISEKEAEDGYRHLKQHYYELNLPLPEFRKDYNESELLIISMGKAIVDIDENKIEKHIDKLISKIDNLKQNLSRRLKILEDTVELAQSENKKFIKSFKKQPQKTQAEYDPVAREYNKLKQELQDL